MFKLIKSGDCGGDPLIFAYSDTVNLKTLKITQLRKWFEDDLHYELMDLVGKQAFNQRKAETVNQEDKHDCINLYTYQTVYYDLSIGKKGLIFSTQFPNDIYACSEDVEIPYATLIPYLNAEGKKQVDKLKASES